MKAEKDDNPRETPQAILAAIKMYLEISKKSMAMIIFTDSKEAIGEFVDLLKNEYGINEVALFEDTLDDNELLTKKFVVINMDYEKWGEALDSLRPNLTTLRPGKSVTIFISPEDDKGITWKAPHLASMLSSMHFM